MPRRRDDDKVGRDGGAIPQRSDLLRGALTGAGGLVLRVAEGRVRRRPGVLDVIDRRRAGGLVT